MMKNVDWFGIWTVKVLFRQLRKVRPFLIKSRLHVENLFR